MPDLGGDEELAARDVRGGNRSADGILVFVHGGRVEMAIAERERAFDDRLAAAARHAERAKAEARDADAASDDRIHEFFRLLLSHQGKVRPLRSMKRRPSRPRLRSTVFTTNGMLSSIESVAAEVPMSVRTQPGATSKSARGSPAWRAEKHFISMLK